MTVSIYRMSFARGNVVRRLVETEGTCDWCDSRRYWNGKARDKLFQYGWDPDSIRDRTSWDAHVFCSAECYRSYHGLPNNWGE